MLAPSSMATVAYHLRRDVHVGAGMNARGAAGDRADHGRGLSWRDGCAAVYCVAMSIVDDFAAAFNRNDVDALCACFTEDASYVDNFYGEHTGHPSLRGMFQRMFREGRDYRWTMDVVVNEPTRAAAEWTFGYTATAAVPRSEGRRVAVPRDERVRAARRSDRSAIANTGIRARPCCSSGSRRRPSSRSWAGPRPTDSVGPAVLGLRSLGRLRLVARGHVAVLLRRSLFRRSGLRIRVARFGRSSFRRSSLPSRGL
jgi:ketosteroid isomerase-like protein